jgi:hypothetical protein
MATMSTEAVFIDADIDATTRNVAGLMLAEEFVHAFRALPPPLVPETEPPTDDCTYSASFKAAFAPIWDDHGASICTFVGIQAQTATFVAFLGQVALATTTFMEITGETPNAIYGAGI